MGRLSNMIAENILNAYFGQNELPFLVAEYFVALSTTEPDTTGAGVTEPTGGDYARAEIFNDSGSWGPAAGRLISNNVAATFPTATDDWGYLTHFAIFDDPSGGNMIGWGELSTPQTIGTGDTADFPPGALAITAPN